jgi:hypothetical protein
MFSFEEKNWLEYETYYINRYNQGDKGWFEAKRNRLTTSKFGQALNFSPFGSSDDLIKEIKYGIQKSIDEKSKKNMEMGNYTEIIARKLYPLKVEQVGLVVPKWNNLIGTSPDGLFGDDGMIEIKTFNKIPDFVLDSKIYINHYVQIQGSMKILNRKWCDYIACEYEEDGGLKTITIRFYFDNNYWESIYPKLNSFLNLLKD